MKIKFEVDLSDYYDEEEGLSIDQTIRDGIIHEVVHKVRSDFRQDALNEFKALITSEFQSSKKEYFKELILSCFENEKVKKEYGNSNDLITVKEYVTTQIPQIFLNESDVKREFNNIVKYEVEKISKELKDRYDMMFASQLVMKMNENGMLKEDVAKLILPDKSESDN